MFTSNSEQEGSTRDYGTLVRSAEEIEEEANRIAQEAAEAYKQSIERKRIEAKIEDERIRYREDESSSEISTPPERLTRKHILIFQPACIIKGLQITCIKAHSVLTFQETHYPDYNTYHIINPLTQTVEVPRLIRTKRIHDLRQEAEASIQIRSPSSTSEELQATQTSAQ